MFPAPTAEGYINRDSLKKQHFAALEESGVETFVLYSLRHTCLTRWAESGMDVFTLKKLAGHSNIATTERYVHMNDQAARAAVARSWKKDLKKDADRGHKSGHKTKTAKKSRSA